MADDSTKFTLKFGGENTDINAATYGIVLVNTVSLLEETNKELNTGAHLEIKVKTPLDKNRFFRQLCDLLIPST